MGDFTISSAQTPQIEKHKDKNAMLLNNDTASVATPIWGDQILPNAQDTKLSDLANTNYAIIGTAVKDKELQNLLFQLNSKISKIEPQTNAQVIDLLKEIKNIAIGARPLDSDALAKTKTDLKTALNDSEEDLEKLKKTLNGVESYQNAINYAKNATDGSSAFRNEKSEKLLNSFKSSQYLWGIEKDLNQKGEGSYKFNPLYWLQNLKNKGLKEDYKDDVRFTPLKNYIQDNQGSKITNDVYKKNYSALQEKDIEVFLNKINDEFDTKVFLCEDGSVSKQDCLNKIYKEFSEWKKAGGEKAIFPPVLDLTGTTEKMVFEREAGHATYYADKSIKGQIRLKTGDNIDKRLRHEMTHLNIKKTPKGFEKPISNYTKFTQEFLNAGVEEFCAKEYAFKNQNEFAAVAAQGDMSKYSPELKQLLISMGMPDWIFNLD